MYREQNKAIFTELAISANLYEGDRIFISHNDDRTTEVRALGHMFSKTLGRKIFFAEKRYRLRHTDEVLKTRAGRELDVIELIEINCPHLIEEFPLFHGIRLDDSGKAIGILTEDFSQGGRYKVQNGNNFWDCNSLSSQLSGIFSEDLDQDDLDSTYFSVGGRRRIGDFGAFTQRLKISQDPNSCIEHISSFSVKL